MSDEVKFASKSNEIWVTAFTEDAAQKFRESVISIARLDPNMPITVYIDSYGGAVDALAKMIETIDEIPNLIITVCLGKAMSCGAILLSHGDIRFCGKHSRVMIHEVSSGTFGNVHDMHADVKEVARLNSHFMGLLAKNCGLKNYEELRKLIKAQDGTERYMDAHEAVKFGIVDEVGTPRVASSLSYEIRITPTKHREKHKNPSKSKSDNKENKNMGESNVRSKRKRRKSVSDNR